MLSSGILDNIRIAFKKSLQHSRAYADNPYINVLRYVLTGGDIALGEAPEKVDHSLYFVEADRDTQGRVRLPMAEMTNMVSTSTDVFYVDCGYIDDSDRIEYYPEARLTGRLYGDILNCTDSKFVANDIAVGDPIKIYTPNSVLSPGVSGYTLHGQYEVAAVEYDWQIVLTQSTGITGGDMRAFTVGWSTIYRIDSVLYTPDFGYTMIRATELDV